MGTSGQWGHKHKRHKGGEQEEQLQSRFGNKSICLAFEVRGAPGGKKATALR